MVSGNSAIEELLPHRAPFLFVDKIYSVNEKEIIAVTAFNNDNTLLKWGFIGFNKVPDTILLEAMAQCGGAGMRLLGVSKGIFALAYIQTAQFYRSVKYEEEVKYVITNVRRSEKIIKQSGMAYVGNDLIMEASWMSIRIDVAESK